MALLSDWLSGMNFELLTGSIDVRVEDVVFDSRKAAPETVFVSIRGSKRDSHDFIPDCVSLGCSTFVVEYELSELPLQDFEGLSIIKVSDTREALARLSAARFDYPARDLTLIGITGTKGKTSTSYMLRSIFTEAGIRAGLIGTNGSVIGGEHYPTLNTTPESYDIHRYLAMMREKGDRVAILECSSQGFKMERTAGIVFDYGVFLNISPDHIGPLEHADFNEYLSCKTMLFSQCRKAVINMDDPLHEVFTDAALSHGAKLMGFSLRDPDADLTASEPAYLSSGTMTGIGFTLQGIANEEIELPMPGEYNVYNALAAALVSLDLGVDPVIIGRALETVRVDGRTEIVIRNGHFTCLVDYAHNALSMEELLRTLGRYEHGRIVVLFGAGGNRARDRRFGMGAAAASFADFSIFTSDNSRFEKTSDIIADIEKGYLDAGGDAESFIAIEDRSEAIRYALAHAKDGDIIAVIGKGHENYQEENGVRRHFLDKEEILKARDELKLC